MEIARFVEFGRHPPFRRWPLPPRTWTIDIAVRDADVAPATVLSAPATPAPAQAEATSETVEFIPWIAIVPPLLGALVARSMYAMLPSLPPEPVIDSFDHATLTMGDRHEHDVNDAEQQGLQPPGRAGS